MSRGLVLLALCGAALLAEPLLGQCAMCKTALTNSSEGQHVASEFNQAILVMVAAPYLVFGSIAGLLFRTRIAEWLGARSSSSSR